MLESFAVLFGWLGGVSWLRSTDKAVVVVSYGVLDTPSPDEVSFRRLP